MTMMSLFRPSTRRPSPERSPLLGPGMRRTSSRSVGQKSADRGDLSRMPTGNGRLPSVDEADGNEDDPEEAMDNDGGVEAEDDEDDEDGPLLPIELFSTAYLDSLPVYDLTHAIRLLILARCETSLTWDQLRSPQASQFLVKPIQQRIRTSHFSRATLYALMTNCLQFDKEAYTHPSNSGTSRTRALIAELLAIKLLKEFTVRELIDALSYDFYPLQGRSSEMKAASSPTPYLDGTVKSRSQVRVGRVSALEVAIRAQAKRFLAHPVVVQQLEAIWAGTVVFHSAADNLHRLPRAARGQLSSASVPVRRSVTLYDPRDASLLKLSRLRVPRYRNVLSTCSFAVLLALYLAVLRGRSLDITTMEVIFWFWSAGYMLDELVGFSDQGFSLYMMSFWNAFDMGILLLLIVYYALRLYGIVMSLDGRHVASDTAYDVLGSSAVLLFPRLFSVLDHYRYFSQLLVAFRLMAVDLVAVFILIMISCSGFFVAFTLSFGNDEDDAGRVAYALFQMVLGFTPAAWNVWDKYNLLGKTVLTLFLFICHFLIVTILITVLTNSFMAIVANADEEHQFIFAVNTISMVKSDALFSYIAPTNILAWLLTPLRYFLPLGSYVKLNRTVIKLTHAPVLFLIYLYERVVLRSAAFEPTDLVVGRGRPRVPNSAGDPARTGAGLFGSTFRLRQESRAGRQKDRALEEVFRRPFRRGTGPDPRDPHGGREASNVVSSWMRSIGPDGRASPPLEQDRSVVDRLEARPRRRRPPRAGWRRAASATRDFTDVTRSVVSDPEEFVTSPVNRELEDRGIDNYFTDMSIEESLEPNGAEGEDEIEASEDDGTASVQRHASLGNESTVRRVRKGRPSAVAVGSGTKLFATSTNDVEKSEVRAKPAAAQPSHTPGRRHARKVSSATVLYNPVPEVPEAPTASQPKATPASRHAPSASGMTTPRAEGKASPRKPIGTASRPRPISRTRDEFQSAPNLAGLATIERRSNLGWQASSYAYGLPSDLAGDGDDEDGEAEAANLIGAVPSSFATQMAIATGAVRGQRNDPGAESQLMSRMMLARMQVLEEGFKEMLGEVKQLRRTEDHGSHDRGGARSKRASRKREQRTNVAGSPSVEGTMVDPSAEIKDKHGDTSHVNAGGAGDGS